MRDPRSAARRAQAHTATETYVSTDSRLLRAVSGRVCRAWMINSTTCWCVWDSADAGAGSVVRVDLAEEVL